MNEPRITPSTTQTGLLPAWAVGILRGAAICIGLGVIFAWLGVYETGEVPLPQRIVYWTILMAVGFGASSLVNPLIFERWMAGSHPALQIAVVTCLISIPITAGLIVIEYTSDGTMAEPSWWWVQFGYVLVVSALLTASAWAFDRLGKQSAAPPVVPAHAPGAEASAEAPAAATPPVFADRLPAKFRAGMIHAVSAEDHYLRVHTSAGETMILMRLADAIRELGALEGMQTHRSWWVAKQGLAGTAIGDGKLTLKLKSGAEAPVSRTYQKAVKDAGWL